MKDNNLRIIKPADPKKVAAYRKEQERKKRGTHNG